ncbi:MAG: serpin family protein [Chlamydiae bacterium]|nr:serpin family protein [Chlamydiota bacterium]
MVIDTHPHEIENNMQQHVPPVASLETSILKEIYLKEKKSSLIAPLSLDQLVGMIYPLFDPIDQDKILEGVFGTKNKEAVLTYLRSMFENHPELKMGNCCASNVDLSFLKEHLEFLHTEELNLDDAEIIDKVNHFIHEKTQGMIPKLFEDRRDLPKKGLVAMNAGSFTGKFDDPFDPRHTKKELFKSLTKEKTEIDMMWGMKMVRYYENGYMQFVEIPVENSAYFLQLSLPKEDITVENLLDQDAFYFGSIEGKLSYVDITLPKFTLSSTQELLDKLLEQNLPLNKKTDAGKLASVLQKTYFVLEEGGVKAAFVTAGLFKTTAIKPLPSRKIRFDRPFTFRLISKDRLKIMEGVFHG